jgi:DNA-binding HxlR family transcriptional regulator
MPTKASIPEARFAYEGLDRVIHERARLSVLTSLITHPKGLSFNDLKQLCALTDGNLSRHLRVLEQERIVELVKGHDNNRPQTLCRITASGRKRYLEYLTTLEQVVRDAANGTQSAPASRLLRNLAPSKA